MAKILMSDVLPLIDQSKRFPLPQKVSDIMLVDPETQLSQEEIFAILTDPDSEHWQHILDWKNYMRLVAVKDWVFKTSEWYRSEEFDSLQQRIQNWKERSRKLKIWHPEKLWFILQKDNWYWGCNATPRLITLKEIVDTQPADTSILDRFELEAKWLWISLWILVRFQLLLDYKKDNFAVAEGSKQLYYLDDEVYRYESWRDFIQRRSRLAL